MGGLEQPAHTLNCRKHGIRMENMVPVFNRNLVRTQDGLPTPNNRGNRQTHTDIKNEYNINIYIYTVYICTEMYAYIYI